MTRDHVSRQAPLVHRLRTPPPETRPLGFLVPDHVVLAAEMVAHPDSVAEDVHVARAVFVGPFTENGAHLIVLGVVWLGGGRVLTHEGCGLYTRGFGWLP